MVSKIAPSLISTDRIRVLDLEYQFLPEEDAMGHLMDAIAAWRINRLRGPDRIIVSHYLHSELLSTSQASPHPQAGLHSIISLFGIKIEVSPLIRNRGYVLR